MRNALRNTAEFVLCVIGLATCFAAGYIITLAMFGGAR